MHGAWRIRAATGMRCTTKCQPSITTRRKLGTEETRLSKGVPQFSHGACISFYLETLSALAPWQRPYLSI